jgi:dephospho-CoA kinase
MTFKVGLTGGVSTGKTSVSDRFSALGIQIIDADVIARELLKRDTECYRQVISLFGEEVLLGNADINRRWLRDRIFSDATAKQQLEAIIHPAVRQAILADSNRCISPYCIVSVPLLIEANMQSLVDRIVVVDLPEEQQIARLLARDKLNRLQAEAMLKGQCSRDQRLSFADDIIDNSQTLPALDQQVSSLHQHYLQLAAEHA